ncbi:MAG TPA: GIY-YIG nuclease family protein [Fulvivirga sp.]|nr:GIY-YIG nuclease family protein [Fulvivirga sp.]
MYYVYILYSESLKKYYVGQTNDLDKRLVRHNMGHGNFTKKGIPWVLVWKLEVPDRSEAMKLEKKIKGRGAHRFIEENITE